jgi:hypothetical protein
LVQVLLELRLRLPSAKLIDMKTKMITDCFLIELEFPTCKSLTERMKSARSNKTIANQNKTADSKTKDIAESDVDPWVKEKVFQNQN